VRAHCISTIHGDLWLSENLPRHPRERGALLTIDPHDMAGPAWELAPPEAEKLRDACQAFLSEHGTASQRKPPTEEVT